jgi:hypothetical protein
MFKQLVRRIRGQKETSPPVHVGSQEDKLGGVRPMHVDPDDDQPTREDREAQKASGRPPSGSIG